jgi:hypothetical protein
MDDFNQNPQPQHEQVSDGLKIGVIIGTLFIPLLGIIMGIIFMQDTNPNKKAVGKTWLYVGLGMMALSVICICLSYGSLAAMLAAGGAAQQ